MTVLVMTCGPIAAGKSTFARDCADRKGGVLIEQDSLLATLYPGELKSIDDYARVAPRLRAALFQPCVNILRTGVPVVMDWPANTVVVRAWMRSICEAAGADHELHVFETTLAERLRRLDVRNAGGSHPYVITAETVAVFDRFYEPPTDDEQFTITRHV